jgi:hypothetical protein
MICKNIGDFWWVPRIWQSAFELPRWLMQRPCGFVVSQVLTSETLGHRLTDGWAVSRSMIWIDPAWAACRVKVHRLITGPQTRGTGGTLIS